VFETSPNIIFLCFPYCVSINDPYPRIIAAEFIIQIIYKRTLIPVLEKYPHKAASSGQCRMPFFYDLSHAPGEISQMAHVVTNSQVYPLSHGLLSLPSDALNECTSRGAYK